MARSTLSRDFDIGRTLNDFLRRIRALERRLLAIGFAATSFELPVTMSGGVASASVQAWGAGLVRGITASFQIGTATHNSVIGQLPTGTFPIRTITIPLSPNTTLPASTFIQIDTAGEITLFMYGGSAAGTTLRGSGSWVGAIVP